jgi:hypothetical protein
MRNLELFTAGRDLRREGSLLATLDLTSTAMGARLLRRRLGQPLVDIAQIEHRLDAVAYCHESALRRARLIELLRGMPDLERLTGRIIAGTAQPRELVAPRRGWSWCCRRSRGPVTERDQAADERSMRASTRSPGGCGNAATSWRRSRRRSMTSPVRRSKRTTSCGRVSPRSWTTCG